MYVIQIQRAMADKKADINISQNGGEGDMLLPISLGVYRSPRILSLLELHSTYAFL